MMEIAIVHPNLRQIGGAENVCIQTINSLKEHYDVSLITLYEPDYDSINDFFNLNLEGVNIVKIPVGGVARFLGDIRNLNTEKIKNALFYRKVQEIDEYDLKISTKNDPYIGKECIHYVHFPTWRFMDLGYKTTDIPIESERIDRRLFNKLCVKMNRHNKISNSNSTFVTNSNWTRNILRTFYDLDPEVVYPPVNTTEFSPTNWDEREDGFVIVGSSPVKNITDAIIIIKRVQSMGHDIHLHIVGEPRDDEYRKALKKQAKNNSFIKYNGFVRRENLVRLLEEHKYGISCKRDEQFGIVVAEMLASGMIPFVPNFGGQLEIINSHSQISYASIDDGVAKVDQVLKDEVKQANIRQKLPDAKDKFGIERFERQVRSLITEHTSGKND